MDSTSRPRRQWPAYLALAISVITSNATTVPTLIRLAESNISYIETSGIDFDASYRTKLGLQAFMVLVRLR